MVWNPESTLVWNPESRRLESGIQRVEIQNPEAGIRNLGSGIQDLRGFFYLGRTRGKASFAVQIPKVLLFLFLFSEFLSIFIFRVRL